MAIDQKSLKAFFHARFQLEFPTIICKLLKVLEQLSAQGAISIIMGSTAVTQPPFSA